MDTSSPRRPSALGRFLLATAAILGMALGASLSSAPATAAEIDNGITSVTTNKSSYDYTERVELDFTWAVPDSAEPGDTFSLDLPDSLTAASLTPFTLTAPDGTIIANAQWVGGTVTFTLTDYVGTHDGVSGAGHLSTEWNRDVIPENGGAVVLDFGTTITTVTVGPKPDCEVDCGPTRTERGAWKGSSWADGAFEGTRDASGNINWFVEIPGSPAGFTGPITVVDTVGVGSIVDCDSFVVLARPSLAHGTAPSPVDPSRYSISCTDGGFTATFDTVNPNEFIDIQYTGTITDQTSGSYSNDVAITIPGQSWETSVTQTRSEAGGNGGGHMSVSVGDLVWLDSNRDGLQSSDEAGIAGVVLVLTGPDGRPVTDIDGHTVGPVTTDANGKYLFDRLPLLSPGEHYTVTIDVDASAAALEGLVPTTAHTGDPASDSSTGSAESSDLSVNRAEDMTLDFGFVTATVEPPTDPTPTDPTNPTPTDPTNPTPTDPTNPTPTDPTNPTPTDPTNPTPTDPTNPTPTDPTNPTPTDPTNPTPTDPTNPTPTNPTNPTPTNPTNPTPTDPTNPTPTNPTAPTPTATATPAPVPTPARESTSPSMLAMTGLSSEASAVLAGASVVLVLAGLSLALRRRRGTKQ